MKQKLFKIFLKLDLIAILDIKNSFFKRVIVKNSKKSSKEVMFLNYSEYSPYKEFDIIYEQNHESINLWFTDIKQKSNITLPESYILAKYLAKENQDGIFFFDTFPQKLILVKDAKLKYQLSKKNISNYELTLLKKEFAISDVYSYSEEEYKSIFQKAIESLPLINIFNFLSLELNYKTFLNLVVKKIALPVAIFISLLLLFEFANHIYLQNQITDVKSEYTTIRKKSSTLREKMNTIEDKTDKYILLDKELKINNKFINIIENLSNTLKENNTSFLFLRLSQSEFRLKIDTNKTAKVFSEIVNSNYLKDLRIQTTRKNRHSDGESVIITGKIR